MQCDGEYSEGDFLGDTDNIQSSINTNKLADRFMIVSSRVNGRSRILLRYMSVWFLADMVIKKKKTRKCILYLG